MYFGDAQADLPPKSTSTAFVAAGALEESKTLSWGELTKAATLNRRYVRHVGWMPYARQIAHVLGITGSNPDIWSFIQAVADWQARNGMMPNGFFGGGEWYALLTRPRP